MAQFIQNKKLQIEIHSNDPANVSGYTIWRIVNGTRKDTLSRKADGNDFDWMTDKQTADFEAGKYKFTISAKDAINYFGYLY